jgi:hypothetical protein
VNGEVLTKAFSLRSECSFDPVAGGLSTISQDIQLCPSTQYTLRYAIIHVHIHVCLSANPFFQHRHRL